jgi:hypothetical protein
MNKGKLVLQSIFKVGGKANLNGDVIISFEQLTELQKLLKEEYNIELSSVEKEDLRTSLKPAIVPPTLESSGIYLDGKAKRRERRKQERMKRKNRQL